MYEQMSDRSIAIVSGIVSGDFEFPYEDLFQNSMGELMPEVKAFWGSLWHNYLIKGSDRGRVSLPYWSDRFKDANRFNALLISLSDAGWIKCITDPSRHWSEAYLLEEKLLQYVTPDMLIETRRVNKIGKYLPKLKEKEDADLVRVNGKHVKTGIYREGFMQASKTQYYYDVEKLREYQDVVTFNTVKGMMKVREMCAELGMELGSDDATYDAISADIVNHLANKPRLFNQQGNVSDSRGRAIKGSLRSVGNPIGYKDFRALLVIPA